MRMKMRVWSGSWAEREMCFPCVHNYVCAFQKQTRFLKDSSLLPGKDWHVYNGSARTYTPKVGILKLWVVTLQGSQAT